MGPTERVVKLHDQGVSQVQIAKQLGLARSTVQYHLARSGRRKKLVDGFKHGRVKETRAELPGRGVRRYILTSAQNNTKLHEGVWSNLLALAKHYKAELKVGRYAYNVNAYTAQPEKPGKAAKADGARSIWYTEEILPYVSDDRVELAPGLLWCGEVNISPTAERPLRGFETYTGRKSGIFPHAKLAMESIASGKYEATKFNYTTGTVTQMNYLQRKAGQKAEFHHCYGGLLVEVNAEGHWWVRQLTASRDGTIYDVTLRAENGEVTDGHRVEAINWGDVHEEQLDPVVRKLAWGEDGMLDALRPRHQFMHDTLSFVRRNHHDRTNPHQLFRIHVEGRDSVEQEVAAVANFLSVESYRDWCKTVVVNSNHDNALTRWLREADYRADPANALFFLRCQSQLYEQIASGNSDFHIFEWVCRQKGAPKDVRFLREDESYIICRDRSGGIECGMHGHNGPNGARGSHTGFVRMGRRVNAGHEHVAGIYDGLWVAGRSTVVDLGYNVGPNAHSWSHIVTYQNGKRAMITMFAGAWRA